MASTRGRPKIWTGEKLVKTQAEICRQIALGKPMTKILKGKGMPSYEQVCRWLRDDTGFCENYARARQDQADLLADEIITIADTEPDAHKARIRVDARKWVAAKLKPKVYGDHVDIRHNTKSLEDTLKQLAQSRPPAQLAERTIDVTPKAD